MHTIPAHTEQPVIVTQATEWIVVSHWSRSSKPGFNDGGYSYEDFTDLEEAHRAFRDYENGEYPRARAVCIFASRNGVPIGRII